MDHFKSKRVFGLICFSLLPAVLAASAVDPAFSQAPFFQGKTITLIVGAGPGGMGDLRGVSQRPERSSFRSAEFTGHRNLREI
jgi:hypothetical protein